ncbi:IS5/IS1182 family transposase [Nonomuraea deserti]|uniref:IS5/IS1182 family transposase n=1 Tax=Nonomuraea deserti TaxID=1848322 RepID=A0A4R4UR57_9ACTN|nr:IS5/IS1182 family transposase [Nonomuraea deserti]
MIAHRATLDVSRALVQYVTRLLHDERRLRGIPQGSRALSPFRQAVMVVRWFRGEHDIPKLGRDHRISRATAYRYIHEGIGVLAAQAPDLHEALDRAQAEGLAYVILDGTLIGIDRCAEQTISVKGEAIDAWYSGKAHQHAGNLQALSAPNGLPLWIAEVTPGSVHDLTAARAQVLGALYAAAAHGLPTLADSGYDGAGIGIHTPIKQPEGTRFSAGTTAPTTGSYAPCVVSANADSPCSKAAGGPSSTSPSAPAESVTSPAQHLSSPISSTTIYRQFAEITSMKSQSQLSSLVV